MKISIYAAYHRAAPRLVGEGIVPIQVGRANSNVTLCDMIGDDSGDNISERNGAWCELTALYWAWKNDRESDYIGLVHYRRVLDVTDTQGGGTVETFPEEFDVSEWGQGASNWIFENLSDYDVVVPREHEMGRRVEANYCHGHQATDWDVLRELINTQCPEYRDSFEVIAKGNKLRLGNMGIMSRVLFDQYCEWLFGLLFAVEAADVNRENYSVYQSRYIGFLAERLFSVFIHHLQSLNGDVRIREVGILNTSKAIVTPYMGSQDAPPLDTVNIALSADRAYLPHAAAMLRSVMDHADPERSLNIFFLHSGIPAHDLTLLEMMVQERPNSCLHLLNIGGAFDESYRSKSRAPSNATYNRFLLFSLLPGLDRLLYLDCDMIVNADVCALFDSDIGASLIGAVPDWIMTRTLTGPIKTIDPDVPDLSAYQQDILGLTDEQKSKYFNAGVLLFNFAAMKDPKAFGDTLLLDARNNNYLFRDQDILNRAFKDSYVLLDARWNVFNSTDASYGKVPLINHTKAMKARQDPWILHFADGAYKPWKSHAVPHAGKYWSALIRTPFYAEVIAARKTQNKFLEVKARGRFVRFGIAVSDRFPFLRGPMLKIYAFIRGVH